MLARRSRLGTLFFAGLLVVGAIGFAAYKRSFPDPDLSLVQVALAAMSVVYGALLGVFGCGFLTGRGNSASAVVALAVGSAVGITLFFLGSTLGIAWVWRIPISAGLSFAITAWTSGEKEGGDDALRR